MSGNKILHIRSWHGLHEALQYLVQGFGWTWQVGRGSMAMGGILSIVESHCLA